MIAAIALLAGLAVDAATAAAQQAPEPPAAPVRGPAAATLTADELFVKAIAAQCSKPPAESAAPLALHVKVQLQYLRDPNDPKSDEIAVEAERKFLAPDRLWTHAISSFDKSEIWSGFDGKRPWVKTAKGIRWLDEAGGESDLKQLRQDLDLTGLITRAFDLARLRTQLSDLVRSADESGHGITAHVVDGNLAIERDGEKKSAKVRLWFEQGQFHLMGARLEFAGERPLDICFWGHERDANGLDVPRKIEVFRSGDGKPMQRLFVEFVKMRPALTDADFAPPKK